MAGRAIEYLEQLEHRMKFDIITFGSASKDITIRPKNLTVLRYKRKFAKDQGFVLPVGSKIDVNEIQFNTGGVSWYQKTLFRF